MNQAMTCSLVPTSGAITSVRGPTKGIPPYVTARQVLELFHGERAWIDRDAALAAAVGRSASADAPAHPDSERRDLADVDVGGEARAPWRGPSVK